MGPFKISKTFKFSSSEFAPCVLVLWPMLQRKMLSLSQRHMK